MIEPDERFRDYNMYRRLVRRGAIKPYTHDCGTEYVSGYGEDDDFVLNCYKCDVTIYPGTAALNRIHEVVEEHFDD